MHGHNTCYANMSPGHWEPNVMPFGLSNALATFQEFINEVLEDLIATGLILVYLNDILIATCYDPASSLHKRNDVQGERMARLQSSVTSPRARRGRMRKIT